MSTACKLLVLTALQFVVALVFLKGFLLTRVELPDVAQCQGSSCSSKLPTYQKAVVLIVDAVRYDFLCGKQSESGQLSGSLMPKTLRWVQTGAGAAVASRFVADTPTITMSRLKALLTGGLPTFLDIGQSFSASAITEDNLLQQLLARNTTLVMMGDDTWMQLAQHAFAEAYPFPSFNVQDLHTVDDGVWEHLLPLLARPDSWDVLIAHYLGVDHAGHTYGVNSRQMEDKLAQMDEQVSTVIESLVGQAGPGGVYADTLLVVLSDHGQTQGGDHGGGTPDETDSILVAMSLSHMNSTLEQQQDDTIAGHSNRNEDSSSFLLQLMASSGYSAQGPAAPAVDAKPAQAAQAAAQTLSELLVCRNTVPQIDLTPLLAHTLGVPIPFGNLGKLPPHLFAVLATAQGLATQPAAWLQDYSAALAANAAQVHAYLNRYAAVGGLPAGQLAAVNEQYAALQEKQQEAWGSRAQQQHEDKEGSQHQHHQQQQQGGSSSGVDATSTDGVVALQGVVAAQLQFLGVAADLARRRFTLFQQGPIWAGCVLGVLVLVLQLWYLRKLLSRAAGSDSLSGQTRWDRVSTLGFAGLAAFHALGLFSVGLLMGEGRLVCVLMGAVTLLLLRAALAAVLQARKAAHTFATAKQQQLIEAGSIDQQAPAVGGVSGGSNSDDRAIRSDAGQQLQLVLPAAREVWSTWRPAGQVLRAATSMLVCNVSLQLLGLIDRSGQDPHDKTQPSAELLVGPDAAWQRSALLAFTVGPLVVIWGVACAVNRLLQARQSSLSGAGALGVAVAAAPAKDCQSKGVDRGSRGWVGVLWCLRAVAASQYVCLGLFWAAQLFGHSDTTLVEVGRAPCTALLPHLPRAEPLARLISGLMGSSAFRLVASAAMAVCSLPLRLLLPRVIYTAALLPLAAAVLLAVIPRGTSSSKGTSPGSQAAVGGSLGVEVLLWLCVVLAGPVVMVLGFKGPATVLLALLQAVGLCKLLRVRGAAASFAAYTAATSGLALGGNGLTGRMKAGQGVAADGGAGGSSGAVVAGDDGCCSVVGAGAWGLMALQLFFCSGHFCEFSGLQYASAFIGFDDMLMFSSGSLLLINTCGFLFLAPLSLPVFVACCDTAPLGVANGGSEGAGRGGAHSAGHKHNVATNSYGVASSVNKTGPGAVLKEQVECGLWVINCIRFAALVVSLVSAAVQQQHILLWAIFAPKLVFELWFMLVTAAGELLAAGLLPHSLV